MPQGLQCFDESGGLIVDVTDRMTKILGTIAIPTKLDKTSGQLVIPDLILGNPFYFTQGNEAKKSGWKDNQNVWHGFWGNNRGGFYPNAKFSGFKVSVTFDGMTMNWSASKFDKTYISPFNDYIYLHYGIY
ncbi:hypothetical protein RMB12_05975 [Acinetobacter sp. V117_2]|uniref:hypothetical protein n=1 Tax=Acinetobacter sp. V117_2 TaxID=3072989 RepID=UPI00287EF31D|nr:hypothetical protein [Acinetobacter sp. V117_2]MDS7966572.1 hypothetical protein [Acinetobacter sp. V117_2]